MGDFSFFLALARISYINMFANTHRISNYCHSLDYSNKMIKIISWSVPTELIRFTI